MRDVQEGRIFALIHLYPLDLSFHEVSGKASGDIAIFQSRAEYRKKDK